MSGDHGLLCRTPIRTHATIEHITLSLNAQQYTGTFAAIERYNDPHLTYLSPPTGPSEGGTTVVVHGTDLLSGNSSVADPMLQQTRYCTFGRYHAYESTSDQAERYHTMSGHLQGDLSGFQQVPATIVSETTALCITPSLPLEGRQYHRWHLAAPVELTLNQQNFTNDGINFTYYQPTVVSHISPTTGPAGGDTLITISGYFSELGSRYNCSFGVHGRYDPTHIVPATRMDFYTILCVTVPLPSAVYPLHLSLNEQDYTPAHTNLTTYDTPQVYNITPQAGPVSGGTLVTLIGEGLSHGSDRWCVFKPRPPLSNELASGRAAEAWVAWAVVRMAAAAARGAEAARLALVLSMAALRLLLLPTSSLTSTLPTPNSTATLYSYPLLW